MSKKQNQPEVAKKPIQYDRNYEDRVYKVLANLTHRALQKECVIRGIDFEDMLKRSHHNLVSWFFQNFDNTLDESRLAFYDAWKEAELRKAGYTEGKGMLSPCLRLGYTKGIENLDKVKDIKPSSANNVPRVKKPKAEVDPLTGVRQGTKKAMSVDLGLKHRDMEIDQIIKLVKEKFPDAEPKSIKIWVKKFRKLEDAKK